MAEPLTAPETQPVLATHADVNNTTMTLQVPLTDVNGTPATKGAATVEIDKSNIDGLTQQEKLALRNMVIRLLQIRGVIE